MSQDETTQPVNDGGVAFLETRTSNGKTPTTPKFLTRLLELAKGEKLNPPEGFDGDLASVTFETRLYEQFGFFDFNRELDTNHVKRLKRNISSRNYLRHIPIVVTPVDGVLRIIDGQHRFQASRELELSIFYTVLEGFNENDLPMLQIARQWQNSDHMHFYAEQGNEHYQFISSLVDEYNVSLTQIERILAHSGKSNSGFSTWRKEVFRDGHVELLEDERQELIKICTQFDEVQETLAASGVVIGSRCCNAWLHFRSMHEVFERTEGVSFDLRYNHEQVIEQVSKWAEFFVDSKTTGSEFLEALLKAYDYKLQTASKKLPDAAKYILRDSFL